MNSIPIQVATILICYYRPPTKLREGNVFTGICLSTAGGGGREGWVLLVPGPFIEVDGRVCPEGGYVSLEDMGYNGIRSVNRRFASYWNAILLREEFRLHQPLHLVKDFSSLEAMKTLHLL